MARSGVPKQVFKLSRVGDTAGLPVFFFFLRNPSFSKCSTVPAAKQMIKSTGDD